jgi:ABC-type sugar transport system substrate-binding protein
MTHSTKLSLACTTALIALGGAASAQSVTIGITQNNVGVDSYQTTYEQAFIAAAEEKPDVEVVVLDAGGDVARQIAQIQDLIQQDVDAMIIWPTNGQAVIPAVREAYQAEIPVIITNSNIAEDGFDFITSFSGPDNVTQGRALGRDHVRPVQGTGHPGRGPRGRDHRPARLHDRHRAQRRLPGASARGLPQRHAGRQPAGQLEPRGQPAGDGSLPRPV